MSDFIPVGISSLEVKVTSDDLWSVDASGKDYAAGKRKRNINKNKKVEKFDEEEEEDFEADFREFQDEEEFDVKPLDCLPKSPVSSQSN